MCWVFLSLTYALLFMFTVWIMQGSCQYYIAHVFIISRPGLTIICILGATSPWSQYFIYSTYTLVKFPPRDPISFLCLVKDELCDVIESFIFSSAESSTGPDEEESSSRILQLFFRLVLTFATTFLRLSCSLEERRTFSDITIAFVESYWS